MESGEYQGEYRQISTARLYTSWVPCGIVLFKMDVESSRSEKVDIVSEFNLLPAIFDIINSVQKTGDTQEMVKKVNSFRAKLHHCRELLNTLPGLDMSCEEQKALLDKQKKEFEQKSALLTKYKDLPVFSEAVIKEML